MRAENKTEEMLMPVKVRTTEVTFTFGEVMHLISFLDKATSDAFRYSETQIEHARALLIALKDSRAEWISEGKRV